MPILVMSLVHSPTRASRRRGFFFPSAELTKSSQRICTLAILIDIGATSEDGPGQFLRLSAKNVQFYTDTDWLAGNDSRQPPPAID